MTEIVVKTGDRAYLRNGIGGEPCLIHRVADGVAECEWPDMPPAGRWTKHPVEDLIKDEAFQVHDLGLDEETVAA